MGGSESTCQITREGFTLDNKEPKVYPDCDRDVRPMWGVTFIVSSKLCPSFSDSQTQGPSARDHGPKIIDLAGTDVEGNFEGTL